MLARDTQRKLSASTFRFCDLSHMRHGGGGDAVEWYTAHRPPVGGVGEGEGTGVGVGVGVASTGGRPAQTYTGTSELGGEASISTRSSQQAT